MGNPPEIPSSTSDERGLARIIGEHLSDLWRTQGPRVAILYLALLIRRAVSSKYFYISLLFGAGIGLMASIGQSYAIGLHPAWKLYGWWWVVSPLYGPATALTLLLFISALEEIERQTKRYIHPKLAPWLIGLLLFGMIGAAILAGTYEGTRQDNPDLANSPPSTGALSKSVGDQNRVLNELSRTGKTLLGQLAATESELESAKKQLSATLANFDAQRGAAEQVTEALKRIDARQKQLALQTEELERILEGQQPITRQDLRRSTMQGLVSGLAIGFVTSLLASATYNAFLRGKPPAG